jgi:hypothetical protein
MAVINTKKTFTRLDSDVGVAVDRFRASMANSNTESMSTVSQTREHLFRHCSRWRDHQKALWKAVGKATGWKRADADTCRSVSYFP